MTVISYYGLLLNRNANNGHKSYLHDEVLAEAEHHAREEASLAVPRRWARPLAWPPGVDALQLRDQPVGGVPAPASTSGSRKSR